MKNNVYLRCVYKKNLGDDLIIRTLCERYPNTIFHVVDYRNKGAYLGLENLVVHRCNNFLYRLDRKINTLLKRISSFDRSVLKKCDIVVSAAGSIFMEPTNQFDYIWYKKCKRPYYIIGSNIGPIRTRRFFDNVVRPIIANSEDTCLRDEASYNMCRSMRNVRLAPDVVFSYNIPRRCESAKKEISLSVINCAQKSAQMRGDYDERYTEDILKICEYFGKKNYIIKIFPFCDEEGDDVFAEQLFARLGDYKAKIIQYDGELDSFVREFVDSSVIIGSRFHANILGLSSGTPIVPISYNDKTRSMLDDIAFDGLYIDLEKDNVDFNPQDISLTINSKRNIDLLKKRSSEQFRALDKILK